MHVLRRDVVLVRDPLAQRQISNGRPVGRDAGRIGVERARGGGLEARDVDDIDGRRPSGERDELLGGHATSVRKSPRRDAVARVKCPPFGQELTWSAGRWAPRPRYWTKFWTNRPTPASGSRTTAACAPVGCRALPSFPVVIDVPLRSLIGIDVPGRDELRSTVGADPDTPGLAVNQPMVVAAQSHAVVSIGRAAMSPKDDVVDVAPARRTITARKGTSPVSEENGHTGSAGVGPAAPADIDRHPRPVENDRQDPGVAG